MAASGEKVVNATKVAVAADGGRWIEVAEREKEKKGIAFLI